MIRDSKPITKIFFLWLFPILLLLICSDCSPYLASDFRGQNEEKTVEIAFLGDIMLGRGVARAYSSSDDRNSWETALSGLESVLQKADYISANLESPVSERYLPEMGEDKPENGNNLCAPPEALIAVQSAGIDLVTLANNHAEDCNINGTAETARFLDQAGISYLEQEQVFQTTINGLPISYLAFDDISSPVDTDTLFQQINSQYLEGRIVIVSIHWGREYMPEPDMPQQYLAQSMADSGAAIIWGHHPHVLQPVEWVQGSDIPHRTLVAYSLGNTLFDQAYPKPLRQSAVLLVTFKGKEVFSFETIPTEITLPQFRTIHIGNSMEK